MKTISSRSVRYMYVMVLAALATFATVEAAMGGREAEGLSSCGTQESPCALPTLTVAVDAPRTPARVMLAEGLAECGSEAQPCQLDEIKVTAEASNGRLAASTRQLGMTLRVKS
jgi:hypothetical protein